MGEAKRRGSFATRKTEAIIAGRIPEERRAARRDARVKADYKKAYITFMQELFKKHQEALPTLKNS